MKTSLGPLFRHGACTCAPPSPVEGDESDEKAPIDPVQSRIGGHLSSAAIADVICDKSSMLALTAPTKKRDEERPHWIYVFGGTPSMRPRTAVSSRFIRLRRTEDRLEVEELGDGMGAPRWPSARGHAKLCSGASHRFIYLFGGYGYDAWRVVQRHPLHYASANRASRSVLDVAAVSTTVDYDDVVVVPTDDESLVVLQAAGLGGQLNHLSDLWAFDTRQQIWSCLSPSDPTGILGPAPRHGEHLFNLVYGGREYLLLLGGLRRLPAAVADSVEVHSQSLWLFEISNLRWQRVSVEDRDLPPGRGFYCACLHQTRSSVRVFIQGGLAADGSTILGDAWFIDITASLESGSHARWTQLDLQLPPRYWHASVLRGHAWIMFGGRAQGDRSASAVFIVDVSTLSARLVITEPPKKGWKRLFRKGRPRFPRVFGHTLHLSADSQSLLIVGGIREGGAAVNADAVQLVNGVRLQEIVHAWSTSSSFPLFDEMHVVLSFV